MDEKECISVLLSAAQRGDSATSITAYTRSLNSRSKEILLSSLAATPEGIKASTLLNLLWPLDELHPRILTAVSAAAVQMQATQADALLTEAEALLAADAASSTDPRDRLRRLTMGATALLAPSSLNRHSPRLVSACARCAFQIPIVRARESSDRMLTALVDRVAVPSSENAAAAILATLQLTSIGSISQNATHLLRSRVVSFVQHANGLDGHDTPAIFGAVLSRISTEFETDADDWTRVALQVIRLAHVRYFADLLSLFEWHLADTPMTADRLLRLYGGLQPESVSRSEHAHSDISILIGRVNCRDMAILYAILRSADVERYHGRILSIVRIMIRYPKHVIDSSAVSGSSSSTESPEKIALSSVLFGSLDLPGMELRCATVLEFCEWLLICNDSSLREWGVNIIVELFVRHNDARGLVLDSLLCGLTEISDKNGMGHLHCSALERLASHGLARILFRDHTDRMKHWIGYATSMPYSFGLRMIRAFAVLAVSNSGFCDFFTLTMRKLSCARSSHSQGMATAGLISLLKHGARDKDVSRDAVAMLCDLFQAGTVQTRASILTQLESSFSEIDCSGVDESVLAPLHQVVFHRIARLGSDNNNNGADDCFPLRLDSCFHIQCNEPVLKDAVPELLEYIIVRRNANTMASDFFSKFVKYVSDPNQSVKDATRPYPVHAFSAKWIFIKSRLLAYMCEFLLNGNVEIESKGVLLVYSGAIRIRDCLLNKTRPSTLKPTQLPGTTISDLLNSLFTGRERAGVADHITAREASSRGFSTPTEQVNDSTRDYEQATSHRDRDAPDIRSDRTSIKESNILLHLKDMDELMRHEPSAALALSCEFLASLFELQDFPKGCTSRESSPQNIKQLTVVACRWLAKTHPWLESGSNYQNLLESEDQPIAKVSTRGNRIGAEAQSSQHPAAEIEVLQNVNSSAFRRKTPEQDEIDSESNSNEEEMQSCPVDTDDKLANNNISVELSSSALPVNCRSWRLSSYVVDVNTKSILDRSDNGGAGTHRTSAMLRYYALQILCNVFVCQNCENVWNTLSESAMSGLLQHNLGETEDGAVCGDPTISQMEKWKAMAFPYAILTCFEREFEFSMTTSLAITYLSFLQKVISAPHPHAADSHQLHCFKKIVCRVVMRIMATYKVTLPTVVRPLLRLLLDCLDNMSSVQFLKTVFYCFDEKYESKQSQSDDEDDSRQRRRRSGRPLAEFDADIVAEGLAMDDVFREGPDEATSAEFDTKLHQKTRQGDSLECNATKLGSASSTSHQEESGANSDDLDNILGSTFARKENIMRLSCLETEECALVSVSTSISFLCGKIQSIQSRLSLTYHHSGSQLQNLESGDSLLVKDTWSLICIIVLGSSATDSPEDAQRRRYVVFPGIITSRVTEYGLVLISLGRDVVRRLKSSLSSARDIDDSVEHAVQLVHSIVFVIDNLRTPAAAARTGIIFEGRFRYLYEQLEFEISVIVASYSRNKSLHATLLCLEDCLKIACTNKNLLQGEKSTISMNPTNLLQQKYLTSKKKRRRLRSRNSVVDEWLADEQGRDNYADMEDFLVDMNQEGL